jgi:intraflagellar transport protein 46
MDFYQPKQITIESKLKPFIPEYIPAVGEVDAFLKPPRPDKMSEGLGIFRLDEPCLNMK